MMFTYISLLLLKSILKPLPCFFDSFFYKLTQYRVSLQSYAAIRDQLNYPAPTRTAERSTGSAQFSLLSRFLRAVSKSRGILQQEYQDASSGTIIEC